ncbi:MAG: hypothetical protein AVO35_10130 [Candidatus Aegiribacteria sp. MLS_C]|nr:MAG: hypothetical protein AVO35_10130 [Candidatus Aegiribacteria sp. MLS_C]
MLLISFLSLGQTPFEFAVVEDLIGGSPFVSVIRIEIVSGVPGPGSRQLVLTTRAGMLMEGEQAVFPDSSTSNYVTFSGLVEYRARIPVNTVERVFAVVSDCLGRFPDMGITDLALDVVDVSDLSWISIDCPIARIDSVLEGSMTHEQFWRRAELRELEVGTVLLPVEMRPPLVPDWSVRVDTLPTATAAAEPTAQPWKSLILPGWGQLSSGRGVGWLNLAVEAGAVALIVSGEDETGFAVLGANHFVSFIDLF